MKMALAMLLVVTAAYSLGGALVIARSHRSALQREKERNGLISKSGAQRQINKKYKTIFGGKYYEKVCMFCLWLRSHRRGIGR
jgi:hypothetical protein